MPTVGTMFFTESVGSREFGWSESHVMVGAADLIVAAGQLRDLAELRGNLMGAGCTLDYMRVSDSGVFRDSQIRQGVVPRGALVFDRNGNGAIKPVPKGGGGGADAPDVGINPILGIPIQDPDLANGVKPGDLNDLIADQPEVGLLVRLEGGVAPFKTRRSLLLRGLPDGITWTDSDIPLSAHGRLSRNWLSKFTDFHDMLLNGKYGMMGIDQGGGNAIKAVGAIAVDNVTTVITITIPGLGAAVGDKVRISGVKTFGNDGKVQTWAETLTVSKVAAADQYVFVSNQKSSKFVRNTFFIANVPIALGNAQAQKKVSYTYTRCTMRRWGKKDTGIPFDQPRGRRKRPK